MKTNQSFNSELEESYITSCKKQFAYYKDLADKSIDRLSDADFFRPSYSGKNEATTQNSVAILVKHIAGNMKSRWTDAFVSDGEKEWRHRDTEFVHEKWSREAYLTYWEEAWKVLFDFIESLDSNNIHQTLYIRNMGHTVVEAMNRQLMHYAYHIGQIVLLSKMYSGAEWESLSIPKGASVAYNKDKFSKEKSKKHFTEDL